MGSSAGRSRVAALGAALAAVLAGCGDGGDGGTSPASLPATPTTTDPVSGTASYASSVSIGDGSTRRLDYTTGGVGTGAAVIATSAAPLLPAGATPLVAEHFDTGYPGMRVTCVSGSGQATNVVGPINLGVIAESAAVLLVYDGNCGTTVNLITRSVTPAQMSAMLSQDGLLAAGDPVRPLRLYWRIYGDTAGRRLPIELGTPAAGASATARGFVALYTGA